MARQGRTGLIARKLGMTRLFNDDGSTVPVTVLQVFDGMPEYAIEMLHQTRPEFERGFFAFHEKQFGDAARHFEQVLTRNPSDSVAQMYLEKARYFGRFVLQP